jgi:hypothetical protein
MNIIRLFADKFFNSTITLIWVYYFKNFILLKHLNILSWIFIIYLILLNIYFLLYIFWVLILTRSCIPTGICILIKLCYIFDQSLLVYFPHENIQSIRWIWNCWHNRNWLITYPPFIIYFGFYSIFLVYSFFQVGVTCVLFSVRIRLSNRLFWSFCFYCIFCLTDRVVCWC